MKSIAIAAWAGVLPAALLLGGCNERSEERDGRNARLDAVALERRLPEPARGAPPQAREASEAERQLSYSHELEVSLPATELRGAYQGLLEACAATAANGCVVMSSAVSGSEWPQASIAMKIRRDSVPLLRKKAEGLGQVTRESTTAEDLGGPLVDTERRLAMKKSLRDSLLELRGRSRAELEPLLKVTEKLAEVQAEIEADEGQRAGLKARLAADNFSLELRSVGMPDSPNEIVAAMKSFGRDLSRGAAGVIGFVAYLLPWLVLLLALPFVWRGARKVWRWRK